MYVFPLSCSTFNVFFFFLFLVYHDLFISMDLSGPFPLLIVFYIALRLWAVQFPLLHQETSQLSVCLVLRLMRLGSVYAPSLFSLLLLLPHKPWRAQLCYTRLLPLWRANTPLPDPVARRKTAVVQNPGRE
jgi:hypothetical protein